MNPEISKAVEIIGSQSKLARVLNCSPVFVHLMLKQGKRVPATMCLQIERACKKQVTRYDLRPDVFGDDPRIKRAAK